jgi:rod shape determining protein RodA
LIKALGKKRLDSAIIGAVLIIILIGLVCLYSATASDADPLIKTAFGRQFLWTLLGALVMFFVFSISLNFLFRSAYYFYGLTIVFLILVLTVGSGSVDRWIQFGGIQFQPSEVAKVFVLMALARYYSEQKEGMLSWKSFLVGGLLVFIPMILIIKQPDVGTAMVFLALFVGMSIWGRVPWRIWILMAAPILALASGFHRLSLFLFIIIFLIGTILLKYRWWLSGIYIGICFFIGFFAPQFWAKLEPYQQQRILVFLGLKSDPHGAAYQVIQSKVAIGSGGIIGKGFMKGSQSHLRFLPEQHTDFIFSVLGEEFGFLGALVVLSLFLWICIRILNIARTARNSFDRYIVVGCFSILTFQVTVNIGMTVGLVPVTGLPIPFLSYGGSSLMMAMTLIGLIMNVSSHRFDYS